MGKTKKHATALVPSPATSDVTMRSLSELRADPKQPRKEFPLDDILATLEGDNPRIWEPLRIRPTRAAEHADEPFTIIEGERRYRAAAQKGILFVPCLPPEDLDETSLRCAQIASAATKRPLRPLEQADAIAQLANGPARLSPEAIALRTGLGTVRLVNRALALGRVAPKVREALTIGDVDERVALAIATISDALMQRMALEECVKNGHGHNVRAARLVIERDFHLLLDAEECGFDPTDNSLPGGECNRCPKNTTAQRSLGLLEEKNTDGKCTDKACFAAKREETWQRRKATARAEGVRVIDGADALKLYPQPWSRSPDDSLLVELDERIYHKGKSTSYRELLGDTVKPTILVYAHNIVHECMTRLEMATAMRAAGHVNAAEAEEQRIAEDAAEAEEESSDTITPVPPKRNREDLARENLARAQEHEAKRKLILDAINPADGIRLWRFLAGVCVRIHAYIDDLAALREWFGLPAFADGPEYSQEKDLAEMVAWVANESRTTTELAQIVAIVTINHAREYYDLGVAYATNRKRASDCPTCKGSTPCVQCPAARTAILEFTAKQFRTTVTRDELLEAIEADEYTIDALLTSLVTEGRLEDLGDETWKLCAAAKPAKGKKK